ncbi:MAG: hypothetical protein IJ779_11805 [Ruminococcus sp.]|nr:hypothetical protein [Ruminococcus sp.]
MKGIIYRELILMKKALILTAVVYVLSMIFAAVVLLAFDYGNLDRSDTEAFEMIRMYSTLILVTVGVCGPSMGQLKSIIDDYNTRWMGFQYTLPLPAETLAKGKYLIRGTVFAVGLMLGILGELYIGIISGTGFRPNMLVFVLAMGIFSGLSALEVPLAMRLRNEGKIAAAGMAIGMPLLIPFFIVVMKITKEVEQRTAALVEAARAAGEEGPVDIGDPMKLMLEVAQPYIDTFRTVLMIVGVPFIVLMFFVGYKLTVKELKRRSL